MHRIRFVLILVMSAFLLFGCSSESPHESILSGETDAVPVVYPVNSSDFWDDDIASPPNEIFTSKETMSDYVGHTYKLTAYITESGTIEIDSDETEYALAETLDGFVFLTSPVSVHMRNLLDDEASPKYEMPALYSSPSYITMYCTYLGYYEGRNMPQFEMGNRDYWVAMSNPTPESDNEAEVTDPIPNPNDFFGSQDRQNAYRVAFESYNFDSVIDQCNTYLESVSSPRADDNAYEAISLANAAAETARNCIVIADDFDDAYTIYYDGVQEISNDIAIVPSGEGTFTTVKAGFYASDWLFFDRIQIKADNEMIYDASFETYDKETDVIAGGSVFEGAILGNVDLSAIANASNAIIRFKNTETGETHDHTLTVAEKAACGAVCLCCETNRNLSDLMFHYNNP